MYQDFSSLPPDQEREFIVYEQKLRESSKSAMTIGLVTAAIFGVLVIAVVLSHDKPPPKIKAEDITTTERVERRTTPVPAAAPATTPTPAPAPATTPTPAPAPTGEPGTTPPATGTADPAGATAPAPPPGATKAPPTAVVNQPK